MSLLKYINLELLRFFYLSLFLAHPIESFSLVHALPRSGLPINSLLSGQRVCPTRNRLQQRAFQKNSLKFIIQFFSKRDNWALQLNAMITSNLIISKILWGVVFCMSAPKCLFIFYNSFSLENLHKKKHFLKTWSTSFVYIIFM